MTEIRDLFSPTDPNGREFPVSSWDKNLLSSLTALIPQSPLQKYFKYSSLLQNHHFFVVDKTGFARHRCIPGRYVDNGELVFTKRFCL